MSTRPSGRLISTTSAHDPSPSAPISTSLKTQATYPPSVRERARKYPTAVAPPISRRSPRRNTRYRAGATPYPDRTFTGWNAPAFLAHQGPSLRGVAHPAGGRLVSALSAELP